MGKRPSRSGGVGPKTTSAHDAARAGNLEALAGALAEDPKLLDAVDALRRTPLHLAAHSNACEAIEMLCARGARVSAEAGDGFTPLHFACAKGNVDAAKALVAAGANPRGMTYKSENALHLALAGNASYKLVTYLLRKRVNVLAVSKKGKSVKDCVREDCEPETREAIEEAIEEATRAKAEAEAAREAGEGAVDVGPSIGPSIGPSAGPDIGPSIGPPTRPVGGKVDRDAIGVVEDDDTDATADGEQEGATKKKKKAKIGAMSFGEDDE